jgi:hypothetical protein
VQVLGRRLQVFAGFETWQMYNAIDKQTTTVQQGALDRLVWGC